MVDYGHAHGNGFSAPAPPSPLALFSSSCSLFIFGVLWYSRSWGGWFRSVSEGCAESNGLPPNFCVGRVLGTVSERWVWLLVQSVRFDNFSVGVLRCTSCEVMREVCTVLRSLFLAVRSHKRVFTAMLHISYICDLRNAMICIFFVHRTYAIEGLP